MTKNICFEIHHRPCVIARSMPSSVFLKVTLVHWEGPAVPRDRDAKLLRVEAVFSCRDSWCDAPWTKNNAASFATKKCVKRRHTGLRKGSYHVTNKDYFIYFFKAHVVDQK